MTKNHHKIYYCCIVSAFFFIWLPILGGVLFRAEIIPFRPYEFSLLGLPFFLIGCFLILHWALTEFSTEPWLAGFTSFTLLIGYTSISFVIFVLMSVLAFGVAFESFLYQ